MEAAGNEHGRLVAVAQATESGDTMRALGLLGVLIVAKLSILAGRPPNFSIWAPIAYFWQDVLVALAFCLLDGAIRRPWFGWVLYGAAVSYVAVNVPITRVLSSPLTWPMVGAAGGALSDSIKHHATSGNFALVFLIVSVAVGLPQLLRRLKVPSQAALIIPALAVVLLGPFATSRVEMTGLHRNAIM